MLDRLASAESPERLLRRWAARRAQRMVLSAPEPLLMLEDSRLLPSGISDVRSGMSGAPFAEGYVCFESLDELRIEHMLVDPESRVRGNAVLHLVDHVPETVSDLLVAADLSEYERPRESHLTRQLIYRAAIDRGD